MSDKQDHGTDFYEDDEPIEKLDAIWEASKGKRQRTRRPKDTNQLATAIVGRVAERSEGYTEIRMVQFGMVGSVPRSKSASRTT